jgi:hypothetical protein
MIALPVWVGPTAMPAVSTRLHEPPLRATEDQATRFGWRTENREDRRCAPNVPPCVRFDREAAHGNTAVAANGARTATKVRRRRQVGMRSWDGAGRASAGPGGGESRNDGPISDASTCGHEPPSRPELTRDPQQRAEGDKAPGATLQAPRTGAAPSETARDPRGTLRSGARPRPCARRCRRSRSTARDGAGRERRCPTFHGQPRRK